MKKEGAEEGEDGGRQGSGGQRYVYIIEAGGLARSESYGGGKGHGVEGRGGGGKEGHGLKGGRGGKEATGGSLPAIRWTDTRVLEEIVSRIIRRKTRKMRGKKEEGVGFRYSIPFHNPLFFIFLPCGACSREGREEGIERRQRGQMRHDLFHPF